MKKKAFVSLCLCAMLALVSMVVMTGCSGGKLENDAESGTVEFTNINKAVSCNIDLAEGDNEMTIDLTEGTIHVIVDKPNADTSDDHDAIYDGYIGESSTITVNVSASDTYLLTLDGNGNKATGTIKY